MSLPEARYLYEYGSGDRTGIIAVTTNATLATGSGAISKSVDGSTVNSSVGSWWWVANQTGRWVKFDFGAGEQQVVTQITLHRDINNNDGIWIFQGSNDDVSWTDLSDPFDTNVGEISSVVVEVPNSDPYRYYRLSQVSGTTSNNAYHQEAIFRVLDLAGNAAVSPAYANGLGQGNRRAVIALTSGCDQGDLFNSVSMSPRILSGPLTTSVWFLANRTGAWVQFDFPHPVLMTEAKWYQNLATAQGVWRWQGSVDGLSWDNIGSTFTLGGSTAQTHTELNGNTTEYSHYRLLQVSGVTASTPYIQLVEFKVGCSAYDPTVISDLTADYGIEDAWVSDIVFDYQLVPGAFLSDITLDYSLEFFADVVFDYQMPEPGVSISSDLFSDFRILDTFATEINFNYELIPTVSSRVTQQAVLALATSQSRSRITQIAYLAMLQVLQPSKVTQQVVMPVMAPRQIPPPDLPKLVPVTPVIERWSFRTVVNRAYSSREQRVALRAQPRIQMQVSYQITEESHRRELYAFIYRNQGRAFDFPLYYAWSKLSNSPDLELRRLYFDPSHTDIREGEKLAIFNVYTMQTDVYGVEQMHNDGATVVELLKPWYGGAHVVCPVIPMRMVGPSGVQITENYLGLSALNLESIKGRALRTVVTDPLVWLDGVPILTPPPYGELDERIDRAFEWLDNETGLPKALTYQKNGLVGGTRNWVIDRETEIGYWRAFVTYLKGKQKTFRLPTYSQDLPLVSTPALGATFIVTSNVQAYEYVLSGAYRAVAIFSQTGVVYRTILGASLGYNTDGLPVSVMLKLNASIGETPGDNIIHRISYLNQFRLREDQVELQHHTGYSTIALNLEAVNE